MNDWNTAKSDLSELSMYDDAFVRSSVQKRMDLIGFNDWDQYLNALSWNPAEKVLLLNSLHVSYSEFFRNPLTFAVLEKVVLPELIQRAHHQNRSQLRIWSMACASGQEVYSTAMLLEEILELQPSDLSFQLFGTDINEAEIQSAERGWFPRSNLANLTIKRLDRWFTEEKGGYTVKDTLKKHLHFSIFDLNSEKRQSPSESIFGDFDLVFCANILFYFDTASQEQMLHKASSVLSKGGYLITGEVERSILERRKFKELIPQSAIYSI